MGKSGGEEDLSYRTSRRTEGILVMVWSVAADITQDIRAVKASEFYVTREGFSPMSLLQNPMILIAIVSIGGMVLMPKFLDNSKHEIAPSGGL